MTGQYKILENRPLTADVYNLVLSGPTENIQEPGQFVQVQIPGYYLRRPISVCDVKEGQLRLIYKILGKGTRTLADIRTGSLDLLTGLGNGFCLPEGAQVPLLVGGGVGVPPLFYLAKRLMDQGLKSEIFLGFNKEEEVFLADEFIDLGLSVHLATVDGSLGLSGNAVDLLNAYIKEEDPADSDKLHVYACGPKPMLHALAVWMEDQKIAGQLSMEDRMACGFGACMGCTLQTKSGPRRVCKNGPVFPAEEVIW